MRRTQKTARSSQSKGRPLIAGLLMALATFGCSDLQDNPSTPSGPAAKVHPQGWADLETGQFLHGQDLRANGGNTLTCQGCHGEDFNGGIAELSCLSCHADPATGVIHAQGWADLETGQFLHGEHLSSGAGNIGDCQNCHGAELDGGIVETSCLDCHFEPASGVIHPQDWLNPSAGENFHGGAIRASGWNLDNCQTCHGADYRGGAVDKTCLTCHSNTPEDCNVCHGSRDNFAPPEDTHNNSETRFAGVGAHQTHLRADALTTALDCADCHAMPASFADPAHIDGDGRAEIVWGERAQANESAPQYDAETLTCSGTYCHDGGKFGNDASVVWNEVGTGQAACGTCHSIPPSDADTRHPPVAESLTCATCHSRVADADNNIINASLHINGVTDL